MRHDAPFLVMRRAPMIGRPESKARVTVAHQAYRLADALELATFYNRNARRHGLRDRYWIEGRGQSARRGK